MIGGSLSYLERLTVRLVQGGQALSEARRTRHADWLTAQQQPDGGFAGREGPSDLYYTGFGLRALVTLGVLDEAIAGRASSFLTSRMTAQESVIDFLSLVYGAFLLRAGGIDPFAGLPSGWQARVAAPLMTLRREDGGFAKAPGGAVSSTYHTFLITICLELLEVELPDPERVVAFLTSREAEGGGFSEISASKRAGVNPTAAAVATLVRLGRFDGAIRERTLDFLCEMQADDGGFTANTRIPLSDILSTFTALVTLADLEALDEIDRDAARGFAESLEQPSGGFLAASLDQTCDVEYGFYGVGTLALLAAPALPPV